jgi:hypothetical protein
VVLLPEIPQLRTSFVNRRKSTAMSFQRMLINKLKGADQLLWAYPVVVGFTWFMWNTLDEEWLVSLHLAPDPEAINKKVETARLARIAAHEQLKQANKPKSLTLKTAAVKVEEDEPEEEEPEEEEPEEDEPEEESAPLEDEDVPAGEDGDDEEAAEEEEEIVTKPLYLPTKGKNLAPKEVWDNFTIRALNMDEDDDDDEEEEEEEGT